MSEQKRYKGSRAATGAERSQVVSQWRTPEATTNSWRDTHSSSGRTVCRQYLTSGSCMRGDACKFLHRAADGSVDQAKDTNNNSTVTSTRIGRLTRNRSTPSPSRIGHKDTHSSPEECGNWRTTGKCQYDNKCRYSHDGSTSKLTMARTPIATVAAGPPTGSSWRDKQQPCQANQQRQEAHDACVANTWTTICHKSKADKQTETTELKEAEKRVAGPTCGNSFAGTNETLFQQHQEKCANKGKRSKLCKSSNNNWTKVKGTRGNSRRCAAAPA